MSAVVNRERRKTAGQRMTTLVGKAQEEDDAFWGHETWMEDDSGNESFRESDEDSEQRKDQFDSDFDDSETDNEDEEAAAGEEEEREIEKEERGNRQRKSNYVDIAKGGRALMQKAKGVKGSKRAVGNGINAGILLNLPPAAISSGVSEPAAGLASQPVVPVPSKSQPVPTESQSPSSPSSKRSRMTAELGVRATLTSGRERRSQTRKRDSRNSAPTYSDTASHPGKRLKPQSTGVTRKSKRRLYSQEELLLEAVKDTEPENLRWLLARKRVQDSADQDKDSMAALRDKHRGKNVIQKYHSRRGCLITLTFPEMDSVPELLTRRHEPPTKPESLICAVTGKPARYRDPKTNLGYLDAAAFKELRRRLEAGEPLEQKPKPTPKPKTKPSDGATQQPKSPKSPPSGFVVDLGGVAKSPGSTRSSGRKWKPSEKMIQGLGLKKDGDDKLDSSATTAALASAPPLPSMAPNAKAEVMPGSEAAQSGEQSKEVQTATSAQGKPVVGSVAKNSVPKGEKSQNDGKPATKPKPAKAPVPDKAKSANAAAPKAGAKSTVALPAKEQVYVIPDDGENGSSGPRYVTQSELIMQAIATYNRSHGPQAAPNSNGKNQESTNAKNNK